MDAAAARDTRQDKLKDATDVINGMRGHKQPTSDVLDAADMHGHYCAHACQYQEQWVGPGSAVLLSPRDHLWRHW